MVLHLSPSPKTGQNGGNDFQNLYWSDLRKYVQIEFTRCDMCQLTNRSINKYVKLPDKQAEEKPWNKLCVDLIGPYKIRRKWKEPLI